MTQEARREALNSADIAFLCLPDAAAIEAVSLVENDTTAIIDTSTAHRTSDGWTYGFPELRGQREKIAVSSTTGARAGAARWRWICRPSRGCSAARSPSCLSRRRRTGSTNWRRMVSDGNV